MSLGAADQEGHVRHGIVTPAGQAVGEGLAVQDLAATIERDQRGAGRGGAQQKLALAQPSAALAGSFFFSSSSRSASGQRMRLA